MPLVSVIVPVYNTEKYLKRCVDSILAQTFSDFELLLIDDGSTDGSGDVCEHYKEEDSRILVFHQQNKGQGAARNFGMDHVIRKNNSEWVLFVDSDDWIHPEMLELLIKAVIEDKCMISIAGIEKTMGEIPVVYSDQKQSEVYQIEDYYCNHAGIHKVAPVAKLYNKECLRNIRFPEVRACEDEFFTYKVLFSVDRVSEIKAPLYAYFMSENSTMRSPWNIKRLVIIKAFEERLSFFKRHNMQAAYQDTLQYYYWSIWSSLDEIKADGNVPLIYKKNVQRKLALFFFRWRKEYPLYEHLNRYEEAFPKGMRLYWFLMGQLSKLKKRR